MKEEGYSLSDAEEKLKAGINDISRIYSVLTDEKLGQCDRTLSKMKSNIKSKKDFRENHAKEQTTE